MQTEPNNIHELSVQSMSSVYLRVAVQLNITPSFSVLCEMNDSERQRKASKRTYSTNSILFRTRYDGVTWYNYSEYIGTTFPAGLVLGVYEMI
jgi:hypothetical protein